MMQREQLQLSLFLLVAAIVFYLFFRIMLPYLIPICWAAVFTIIFFPLQKRLLGRLNKPNLAALLMCLLVLVLIIGPVTYLFVAVVYQAADAVAGIDELYSSGQLKQLLDIDWPFWQTIKNIVAPYYELTQIDLDQFVKDTIGKVSSVVLDQTSWLIANATKTVFSFGLMVFTMFYLFREGDELVARIKRLLPLDAAQTDKAFDQLREVVQATMYGGVAVALLQGLLGGILFAAVGIESAVFWGAVMAFLSLLPFIGAFLVYVPAGIALILAGSTVSGLVVIAIGVAVISQADNVVRPYLISGKTSMHPLLLFFAILGGITMWGLVGLVVGPMVAAAFVILIKIVEMRLRPDDPGITASG
jgi:predicted PurR-regulated permease PerM